MKHFLSLIIITFIAGCSQSDQSSSTKNNSNSAPEGVWFYKAYIDSTILNKKIHEYSWTCASYAYEISIDAKHPDSCYFKGYHEDGMLPLKRINDKTFHAGADSTQYWIITFLNESEMTLKEFRDKSFEQVADPNLYAFEKRNKTIPDLKHYFVKNIFSGVYTDSLLEITFTDNYEVIGFEPFTSFDIDLDFWEMGPEMDMITFTNKNNKQVSFNWSFNNQELILKKVYEIYDNGDVTGYKADTIVYKFDKIK